MVLNNLLRLGVIENKQYTRQYDIVPVELTTKVEIDFGNGYCLTRLENITKPPFLSISAEKVIELIQEQLPELLVMSGSTDICGIPLKDIISNVNKEKFFKEFETNKNIYYNCDPCSI
jgi:hypothetical protein